MCGNRGFKGVKRWLVDRFHQKNHKCNKDKKGNNIKFEEQCLLPNNHFIDMALGLLDYLLIEIPGGARTHTCETHKIGEPGGGLEKK